MAYFSRGPCCVQVESESATIVSTLLGAESSRHVPEVPTVGSFPRGRAWLASMKHFYRGARFSHCSARRALRSSWPVHGGSNRGPEDDGVPDGLRPGIALSVRHAEARPTNRPGPMRVGWSSSGPSARSRSPVSGRPWGSWDAPCVRRHPDSPSSPRSRSCARTGCPAPA